jgi:hypothetical protein
MSVFPQLFFAFVSGNFTQFSFSSAGHFSISLVISCEGPRPSISSTSMGQIQEKVKRLFTFFAPGASLDSFFFLLDISFLYGLTKYKKTEQNTKVAF